MASDETVSLPKARSGASVRCFELRVADGPSQVGFVWTSTADVCSIGSHERNDLALQDRSISRFHCEIGVNDQGGWVRDLGSRNGTIVDGVGVRDAQLRESSTLRIGQTTLEFQIKTHSNWLPLSEKNEFGGLLGESVAMRRALVLLERAAQVPYTVLIEGETGTGKEGAALSIHESSPQRGGPFVIVDCGAMPPNLLESELFGHEKGAFTGALARRIGAFEEASGGTVFLDEIGELPLELQPKILRVLEQRHVRRIGANTQIPVDVRILAATNRDLRVEVNNGRFRSDLYYRLAVIKVRLPPLRERPEDVPLLATHILDAQRLEPARTAHLRTPEFLAHISQGAWPGNVRELRNYLERCIAMEQPLPLGEGADAAATMASDATMPYTQARDQMHARWERGYIESLMKRHQGNVDAAAVAAGVHRTYLYRIMRRHGIPARPRS
jgi:transcriptional regulator with PAS, ATPase and Fis domain